jgi:hypothetical protein
MGLPDLYSYGDAKGPKNPASVWGIMSSAGKASGFLGWHRHKLNWLDADRKTYVVAGKHLLGRRFFETGILGFSETEWADVDGVGEDCDGELEKKWDLRVPVVQLDSGNCRCRKWTAATKS